jgi:hypothetical protein
MATRSRTSLFVQCRQSITRSTGKKEAKGAPGLDSEKVGLIAWQSDSAKETVVNVESGTTLPPEWMDEISEIESNIDKLQQLST